MASPNYVMDLCILNGMVIAVVVISGENVFIPKGAVTEEKDSEVRVFQLRLKAVKETL